MTLNSLASMIAKREGKKKQARIGEVREILKILFDISYENSDFYDLLDTEQLKRDEQAYALSVKKAKIVSKSSR